MFMYDIDFERYSRQIPYPGFGEKGQSMLKKAHVVVAGLGGLGCAAAMYLAAAGIGRITVVDCDFVEQSNLNRQVLHWDEDLGEKKTTSAATKLRKLNPAVEVIPVFERINVTTARGIIKGADAVIDGLDNFDGRFILNSACAAERIPFIHGGVHGFLGEVTTIIPGETPCLECIFHNEVKKVGHFPVFGVNPALIAILQVTETIKLLAGFGDLLSGKMLYVDSNRMRFTLVDIAKRLDCKVCGQIG